MVTEQNSHDVLRTSATEAENLCERGLGWGYPSFQSPLLPLPLSKHGKWGLMGLGGAETPFPCSVGKGGAYNRCSHSEQEFLKD